MDEVITNAVGGLLATLVWAVLMKSIELLKMRREPRLTLDERDEALGRLWKFADQDHQAVAVFRSEIERAIGISLLKYLLLGALITGTMILTRM